MRPFATLALLLLAGAAAAQPTLSLAGALAVPQRGFGDHVALGGGLSAGAYYQIPRSPLALGVEGTALLYGQDGRRAPLSTTVPEVAVDVVTTNSLLQGLAVLRVQAPDGRVRPYADGLVGVHYLVTSSEVRDRDGYPLASSSNYDDAALVVGGGAGMQVRVHEGATRTGRPMEVLVDARVRYLAGGEASYLTAGDLQVDERRGTYTVAPRTSRTDVVVPQVGVTWRF